MATYLTVSALHDGTVTNRDVRRALQNLDSEDISESSPVVNPATISTAHEVTAPEDEDGEPTYCVHVRTGDGGEEFTKTTTDAIVAAVSTIDGISEVDVDGGYEPPEEDEDE